MPASEHLAALDTTRPAGSGCTACLGNAPRGAGNVAGTLAPRGAGSLDDAERRLDLMLWLGLFAAGAGLLYYIGALGRRR